MSVITKPIGKAFKSFFRGKAADDPNAAAQRTSEQAQMATGETAEEERRHMENIQPVINYLVQQGMSADHAQIIQQGIANASQDDLGKIYDELGSFADAVSNGLVNPGDVSTAGGIIATAVQKQYKTGQAFDFGTAMSDITSQMQDKMPQLMQTANQAGAAGDKIAEQTGALGQLDEQKFNERFQPALMALNQQYKNDSRTLSEQMDARGLQEQGSFAGTGTDAEGNFKVNPRITSESTPVNQARLMLAQQHDKDLAAATLQAQAQGEQQQVSELSAAQQTPEALKGAVEAQASPFAQLSNQTQAEANTNLALQSSRAADTKALADTANTAQGTKVAGASGAAGAEQTKLATDIARRDQTLNAGVAQEAVPQTERLGYGAGVTPGVSGAFSSLASTGKNVSLEQQKMGVGAGVGALAALL